jgi:hypothetical protein
MPRKGSLAYLVEELVLVRWSVRERLRFWEVVHHAGDELQHIQQAVVGRARALSRAEQLHRVAYPKGVTTVG